MLDLVKMFRASEDGAVAVDWVVLSAATVGLGIAVVAMVASGTLDLASDIGTSLALP